MEKQKKKYDKLNVIEKSKLIIKVVEDVQRYANLGETVKTLLTKEGIVCMDCGKEVGKPYDMLFSSGKGKLMVFILCKECKAKAKDGKEKE